ncbi:MAG: nucleotidyl transferase AbiEii/AbiGii toxin family protein [Eggerthellaceae bacterium]|nr:nucleotidyl transferase AbiEii/AbiGii toxin family protein [Eggerthellaceae bacterium]MCH4221277.1 nucleotidyl transferase AbiEii/AbiGii toxin family protein [Eggerthellaceae bacterium]
MLDLIAKSALSTHVTVKGGVLIQHVSKDLRRSTTDIDLDFVRYSIEDAAIHKFVATLNEGTSTFSVKIVGFIEKLKHQDYSGKRINIYVSDVDGNLIRTKIDIGVHNLLDLNQEEIRFDLVQMDEGVILLGNSNEQIVAEKLKSLLRIGAASTRYKDVFDMYYLLKSKAIHQKKMDRAIAILVYDDPTMRERGKSDIHRRLLRVFNDQKFKRNLSKVKNNWLQIPTDKVIVEILSYFQ